MLNFCFPEIGNQKWLRQLSELDQDSDSDVFGGVPVQLDQCGRFAQISRGEAPLPGVGTVRVSRGSRAEEFGVER